MKTKQWFALALMWTLGGIVAGCGTGAGVPSSGGNHTGTGGGNRTGAGGGVPGSTTSTASGGGEGGPEVDSPVCQSPSGFRVCGGPNHCPSDLCPSCDMGVDDPPGHALFCDNDAFTQYLYAVGMDHVRCGYCLDGQICFDFYAVNLGLECAPIEMSTLFIQNGAADRLRYADHGLWTGDPLPEPDVCPALSDVTLCGGKCGGCPSPDTFCTGRSPLHPWGMCIPKGDPPHSCDHPSPCPVPGDACFAWKVQPEAQPLANIFGYCLPAAACKAAADKVPGGGLCFGP